ncbi:epsin 2-like protein, partial [Pavlovales sp. CCMP2436]
MRRGAHPAIGGSALAVCRSKLAGSEIERKIAEATCNKPWGASTTMLTEIAQLTFEYNSFQEIMSCSWKRINESGKNWRVVYKALNLIDYLVRNGSERVIDDARDHVYQIRTLNDFQYTEPGTGVDHGINVREKSRQLCELLNDDTKIKAERDKSKKNRGKFGGVGS